MAPFPFCACEARVPGLGPFSLVNANSEDRRRSRSMLAAVSARSTGRHHRSLFADAPGAAPAGNNTNATNATNPYLNYVIVADSDASAGSGVPVIPPDVAATVKSASGTRSSGTVSANAGLRGETYCMRVNVGFCSIQNRCCNMDLYKIELMIANECWGAVEYCSINGERYEVAYSRAISDGKAYTTLKLPTQLPNYARAADAEVCIKLRDNNICSTAARLCSPSEHPGYCRFSMFNTAQDCCPMSFVSLTP